MKLTMLGTGNAVVTACYNTCFVLQEGGLYFLVDGGGGNTLLLRLKQADIESGYFRIGAPVEPANDSLGEYLPVGFMSRTDERSPARERISDRYIIRSVEHRHEHVDALRARRKQIAHQSVILGRVGSGHQSERVGHFGFPCAVRRRLTHRLNGHRHTGQYQNYLSHFLFIGLRLG